MGAVLPVPILQAGQARFPVHIALEETPESDLLPGMTVRAQIVTAARERTLLVPTRALHFPSQSTPVATPGSVLGTAGGAGRPSTSSRRMAAGRPGARSPPASAPAT